MIYFVIFNETKWKICQPRCEKILYIYLVVIETCMYILYTVYIYVSGCCQIYKSSLCKLFSCLCTFRKVPDIFPNINKIFVCLQSAFPFICSNMHEQQNYKHRVHVKNNLTTSIDLNKLPVLHEWLNHTAVDHSCQFCLTTKLNIVRKYLDELFAIRLVGAYNDFQ